MTLTESTKQAIEAVRCGDLAALELALSERGAVLAAEDYDPAELVEAAELGEELTRALCGLKRALVAESQGLARLHETINAGSGAMAEPGVDQTA